MRNLSYLLKTIYYIYYLFIIPVSTIIHFYYGGRKPQRTALCYALSLYLTVQLMH